MDLATALHIRELGYTVRYSALLDSSFQETAEDTLLKSDLASKFCDFKNPTKSVFILSTSSDGRHIASGHGDHNVYVSQIATGKVVHCLTGHRRTPWTVSFHSTRNDLLASGCLGGEVRVWDLKSGCSELLKTEENTAVASIAFHPRDRYLAIATADKVLLWDWNQAYPFAVCQTASVRERLRFVRFDPTGFYLYTGITNPREMQEPARCMATPPEVMPLRFREMIQSRNELLQMRAELSRSHQRMLQRYNELQSRYTQLRQRYPELAAAAQGLDPPFVSSSTTGYESLSPRETQSNDPVTEPLSYTRRRRAERLLATSNFNDLNANSTSGLLSNHLNRTVAYSDVLQNEQNFSAHSGTGTVRIISTYLSGQRAAADQPSSSNQLDNENGNSNSPSDTSQPPLSPIALEGLRDAVAYAREITTQSMEQFVRQHHDSIARLQMSYRQISGQAQSLMQQFSQTLDDMKKLQEIVDKKYPNGPTNFGASSTSSSDTSSQAPRTSGYALLEALARMREVLEQPPNDDLPCIMHGLSSYDQFSEQNQQRLQMENEIGRLIKVQELIRDFDSTLPMNPATKVYLNHHRIVLNDIRRDVNNATDSQTLNFIRVRLTEEIKEFQSFVRAWKQDIMTKIQDNGRLKSDTQAAAASRTRSVGKTDAQAQTSPVSSDSWMDEEQQPSTSGYSSSSASKRTTKQETTSSNETNVSMSAKHDSNGVDEFSSPINKRRKVTFHESTRFGGNDSTTAFAETVTSANSNANVSRTVEPSVAEWSGDNLREVSINLRRIDDTLPVAAIRTTDETDLLPDARATDDERPVSLIENINNINNNPNNPATHPVRHNSGSIRSMVTINNAVELAMRRRQRLFATRNSSTAADSVVGVLPDSTVRRVRQAAERLTYLERRTELLNEEVARLSQRVADDHPLMTQMELLERREARLLSLHNSQVRALRDLSADNLRRLRSPSPSESAVRRDITTLRRLIDHPDPSSSSSSSSTSQRTGSDILEMHRRSLAPEQRPAVFIPWHRRQTPPTGNSGPGSSGNLLHLMRPYLPDVNDEPTPRRAYVISDRTVNAPAPQISWDELEEEDRISSFDLHRSVNRAIAGAFIGTGDVAVANNILDTTCRIQYWFVKRNQPPDISQAVNVLLGRCKLNNDGSVSISDDGRLLAAFVENDREDKSLWAHTILKVVSLRPEDRGVVLYQKTFAPNAISVSISPAMGHILIGLASRRYLRLRHSPQTFAQVYRMCEAAESADKPRELKLTMNIEHRCNETPIEDMFTIRNESLNCAIWLKTPGHGFCYGTNKGQVLLLCGKENVIERREGEKEKAAVVNDELETNSTTSGGTMRVLFRRNGRMNLLESRSDEQNQYRTVIV